MLLLLLMTIMMMLALVVVSSHGVVVVVHVIGKRGVLLKMVMLLLVLLHLSVGDERGEIVLAHDALAFDGELVALLQLTLAHETLEAAQVIRSSVTRRWRSCQCRCDV